MIKNVLPETVKSLLLTLLTQKSARDAQNAQEFVLLARFPAKLRNRLLLTVLNVLNAGLVRRPAILKL